MRLKSTLLSSIAAISGAMMSTAANAQTLAGPGTPQSPQTAAGSDAAAEDIVVTGLRGSLESAQAIKRNSSQVVDSIVAEDIGKLPDVNVAEALQRITGVQISRNQGEGSGVAIRGLSQVQTLLDGRSIFTAGGGRGFSLEDVPSELLAGADVYKTSAANQIDGGIGGVIDLRLRKPLDFDGLKIAGQVRGNYYDLADKLQPTVSGLISNRWDIGTGQIGALLAASYQKTSFRRDISAAESFIERRDVTDRNGNGTLGDAADAVLVPNGAGFEGTAGNRERIGVNGALQWQSGDGLETYVTGYYNRYKIRATTELLYGVTQGRPINVAGPITLAPGTNDFQSGNFRDLKLVVAPYFDGRLSTTWQAAGGVKWSSGPFSIHSDLAYTKAKTNGSFLQLGAQVVAPIFSLDLAGKAPAFQISGVDLTNPANLRFDNVSQYLEETRGSELAWNNDLTLAFEDSFVKTLRGGFRFSQRKSATQNVFTFNDVSATPFTAFPEGTRDVRLDLFPSYDLDLPSRYVTPSIRNFDDFDVVRRRFGLVQGGPAYTPESGFNITEKAYSGYVMADYDFMLGGLRVSGNGGLRVVRTDTGTRGFITAASGGFDPLDVDASYTSWLPSFNLKVDLTSKLAVRAAASKTLTRPDFSQLTPSLNLSYLFLTGSGGNSALGPIKADQYDLSLEYYINRSSLLYVAGFIKNVDGFITTVVTAEQINGQTFQIGRPQNGEAGKIRGAEVGWNQFFDFLPAPFDGFGLQANYTYVFSEGPSPLDGVTVPLTGLSKHSYNLIGLYEKGPVSLRVAYSWRSKYIASLGGGGTGFQPDRNQGGGYLDASASYDVSDRLTLFVDAANLTRQPTDLVFNSETRPHRFEVFDRRFGFGARLNF